MRKFRTARLNQQQQQGGAEGPGGSGQQAATKPGGSVLDEETRKVRGREGGRGSSESHNATSSQLPFSSSPPFLAHGLWPLEGVLPILER